MKRHATLSYVCLAMLVLSHRTEADDLLQNGNFQNWTDDRPDNWNVDVGAHNPGAGVSQITPLDDGGVELSGNANTRTWRYVAQRVDADPGTYLRLTFNARAVDVRRDRGQFNNCYVGVATANADGQRLSMQFRNLFEEDWAPGQLVLSVPDEAASAEVTIFLSKTGRLQVQSVVLETLTPADSFNVLVDELDRYYSFFDLKQFPWRERAATYREAAQAAESPAAFAEAVRPLLTSLEDLHVWMTLPDGTFIGTSHSQGDANINVRQTMALLHNVQKIGKNALVGRTAGEFGYVLIGSLHGPQQEFDELQTALRGLFDAPGIIVDLRVNGGGDERRGQRIASLFNDNRRLYARQQVRTGAAHDDLGIVGERYLGTSDEGRYDGPVVGLIGPRCISSGEGFAAMLAAIPRVRLVGLPTQGASGNPAVVTLPNGLSVDYSTWISLLPDGSVLEGRGVPPDVRVEQTGSGDAALDAAIELLRNSPSDANQ